MKKIDWLDVLFSFTTIVIVVCWLLLLAIIFAGCSNSIDTPIYDSHPPVDQIVVEYPPQRIIYFGHRTKEGEEFARNCLAEMHKRPYRDYQFNENTIVNSNLQAGNTNMDNEGFSVSPVK
jgi:hypothetical protein